MTRILPSAPPLATPLAIAISLLLSAPVAAQDTTTPAAPQDAPATQQNDLDTIVITGSNLRGIDLQEAQPVIVLDSADLKQIGASTVGDALKQVSETGGGTGNFSTSNSGALQADSPAGSAAASLRGLGTSSTLTCEARASRMRSRRPPFTQSVCNSFVSTRMSSTIPSTMARFAALARLLTVASRFARRVSPRAVNPAPATPMSSVCASMAAMSADTDAPAGAPSRAKLSPVCGVLPV